MFFLLGGVLDMYRSFSNLYLTKDMDFIKNKNKKNQGDGIYERFII